MSHLLTLGRSTPAKTQPHARHATFKFGHAHGTAKPTAEERHAAVVDQTAKWVSQTFFGQMLKQMRESPFKSKMFDGGRGGEAFQAMADQRTADSMARGTGHKLVDSMVRRIEAKGTYGRRGGVRTPAPSSDRGVA